MSDGFHAFYRLVVVVTSMCVGATVLLALAEGRAFARGSEKPVSRAALVLLAVFALALTLRWLLPPHALFHDHNHGYNYLQVMFDTGPHRYRLEYGIGGFNTFRLFLRFLPAHPDSVFGLNAVFGALTVFPVYALGAGLWRSRRAGLFAALAIAVLPPHIRLSATEDLYVLAGLFEATALAGLVAYLRGGARRHLLVAVTAVVVCVSVRETMNLVPITCIPFALWLVPDIRQRLADRALWLAGVAALLIAVPHILFFASFSLADFGAQAPNFDSAWVVEAGRNMVSGYNVYLDPAVVFPTFIALAIAGTALGARANGRALALTWGTLVVFMYVASLKSLTDSDRVMFHAHYGIYVAVLVGLGCVQITRRATVGAPRMVAGAAAAAVLLATPVLALDFLRHESNIQREFTCASEGAALVPRGCRIVTLHNGDDVGREPIAADLAGLPRVAPGRVLSIKSYLTRPQASNACYVYYEQRICYEPSMESVFSFCGIDPDTTRYPDMFRCIARFRAAHPDSYQQSCKRMHEQRRLEPIATCRFRAAPLDVDPMPPGRSLELGYYRIRTRAGAGDRGTPPPRDPDPNR